MADGTGPVDEAGPVDVTRGPAGGNEAFFLGVKAEADCTRPPEQPGFQGLPEGRVAQVVPLLRLRHLGDRLFDYLVPAALVDRVGVGSVVGAPFGRRTVRAVVVGLDAPRERDGAALRAIETVEDDSIPGNLLDLARALAERYLSSYEACLRVVAPPRTRRKAGRPERPRNTWVWPARPGAAGAGGESRGTGAATVPGPGGTEPAATAIAGTGTACQEGAAPARLTGKQRALLEAIPASGAAIAEVCREVGVGPGVVKALVRKELVVLGPAPAAGADPSGAGLDAAGPAGAAAGTPWFFPGQADASLLPRLWPEQEQAVTALQAAYDAPGLSERVLWGITGSGKTEVYLRLVARALETGAGAILLVPEIALTPQMIARVCARFGSRVGVLHSGLSPGERTREYRRIATGEAPVVVGARSAVFAPVRRLRLVIMDESHDPSYKQEEEPRYHARVVAQMRLSSEGGLLLEGSATPPVESLARPETCLRLTHRAAGTPPQSEVVDMRRQGGGALLAPVCREALAEVLRRDEQAIVLLNRRGYAGYVHCDICGHVMMCASCELSLTFHSRIRRLVCHHCGRTYPQPPVCPACGEAPLVRGAPGTERLDRELRALVPRDQVFRLDSDVLTSGTRARAVLAAFAAAHPGVLVGTQMVAKGHDFADVTLVVVADADTGLYIPDFRAAERTFQLLTQVAGRAGRAERPGRVLVQTWNPDVPCIRMALKGEESAFYRQELESRERLGYPPFTDLIRVMTSSEEGERARLGIQYLWEQLSPHLSAEEMRGPVRLPVLRGRHRWHFLVASRDGERARALVRRALAQLEEPYRQRGVALVVDVDPQSFG